MTNNTIYRPKLESGTQATLWSPMSVYTSSLIKQTADGILLEVDKELEGYSTKSQLELTAEEINAKVSSVTDTVSGHTTQISQLQIKADGIESKVDEYTESNTPNLLTQDGWYNKSNSAVIPTDDGLYSASTSYITTSSIILEAGTYCISSYNNLSENQRQFNLTATVTINGRPQITTISPKTTSSTTETYNSCTRYYAVFQINKPSKCVFRIGNSTADTAFYHAKLEKGESPTEYNDGNVHYSSIISQTAKEISLKVQEQTNSLKSTGIDIESGKISAYADKFVVAKDAEESEVFMNVTNDGIEANKLHIKQDSRFGGLIWKDKTVITSDNYDQYFTITTLSGGTEMVKLNWKKAGSFVEFESFPSSVSIVRIPLPVPDGYANYFASTGLDSFDDLRALIDNTVIFINKTNLNVELYAGWTTGSNRVPNLLTAIANNRVIYLRPTVDWGNNYEYVNGERFDYTGGKELIYWQYYMRTYGG